MSNATDTTPIDIATGNFNVSAITIAMVVAMWLTLLVNVFNIAAVTWIKWQRLKIERTTAIAAATAPPPPPVHTELHLTVTPPHSRHHSRTHSREFQA